MQYETLVWLAPTLVGVAVFSAILAFFWPREELAPVPVPDDAITRWYGSLRSGDNLRG